MGELSFMPPELIQVNSAKCSFKVLSVFFLLSYRLVILINAEQYYVLQSFLAGWAAAGTLTSVLRLLTKAAFEKSDHGLRKGACM